jgi:outer membrane autotransporter protein
LNSAPEFCLGQPARGIEPVGGLMGTERKETARSRGILQLSRFRLLGTVAFGAAFIMGISGPGQPAQADDVDITADIFGTGLNLDTFAGTTARIFPGVTVSNTGTLIPGGIGSGFPGVYASTTAWTLTNDGSITAPIGDAIHFLNGGTVINSGTINGGSNGIVIENAPGTVSNLAGATIEVDGGVINIGTFGAPVSGIVINAGTMISNGFGDGVGGFGSAMLTNLEGALIEAHDQSNAVAWALDFSHTIINSGTIKSNDTGFATGIAIQGGTVTNNATGQILGAYNGVWSYNSSIPFLLTNAGLIEASQATAMFGFPGSAIEADAGGTIMNSGIIRSNSGDGTDVGIYFGGPGTITNSGTIQSLAGGLAILFDGSGTHTLQLDTGSVLGGNVQGGTGIDNLVLMGSGTQAINIFSNFETLLMQGGAWTLTGSGTFSTSATVQSGLLSVNGQLTSPALTVAVGATLGGTGTLIGNVTNNGTVAPGNSIGMLNITGNYTQATGSALNAEVNTATSDLLKISGTATIQSGASANVLVAPGFYTPGMRYTILTATGGVSGTYATLTDDAPFVDFQLAYDADNVYLDVSLSSLPFQQLAQTQNQKAAAGALELLGPGNQIFDAVLMLDTPNALRAFDLLSGEIHASVKGTLLEESRFIREAVTGRLRQFAGSPASLFVPRIATLKFGGNDVDANALVFDETALAYGDRKGRRINNNIDRALAPGATPAAPEREFAAWGQTFGNWGHTSGDGNAAALNRTTGGFFSGLDATFGNRWSHMWRFGLAGGYQRTSVDVGDRNSSGHIDTYHLAAYAGTQQGPIGVRLGSAYAWHDIATSRTIIFPGFSDAAGASYSARTAQVFGEIGYGLTYRRLALEPFAGLAYVNVRTGSFTETGNAAALIGFGSNADTTFSTIGLRAAAHLPWPGMSDLVARTSLGWRHAFGTVTPTAELSFASGTTSFVVAGVPIAKDAVAVELGLDGKVGRHAEIGITYIGQLAADAWDHEINGHMIWRF